MNESTLNILEFDKIKRMLARCSASDLGHALALELSPSDDISLVRDTLNETSQMKEVFLKQGRPPFGKLSDIGPLIQKASRVGAVMDGVELIKVAWTTSAARELKDYFLRLEDEPTQIMPYIYSLDTTPELEREIRRCLDDEGVVADNASPKLAKLKREIKVLRGRIIDRLNDMIAGKERASLQEGLVTIRNGRYVLPVKREERSLIKGIVHDQSASASTLYIEPMALVEMNNRIQIVLSDIEHEVVKILADLTAQVGAASESLTHLTAILAKLDLIWARASLSLQMNGEQPEIVSQGGPDIIGGRHPLLELNEDLSRREGQAVAVDISLGGEGETLVITGPNTGGKTVSLKMVGLFTLMAQGGLHLPADPRSRIRIFSSVHADIGDDQSIEHSISTFSSHIGRIAAIVAEAGPGSLVLLDEIGVGTDPVEGAALSQAILEHLHRRGATTVATTHYSPLKKLAFEAGWAANAAVQFDPETLRPTYRLTMGTPGGSHALYIADRLGLPGEVVHRARELTGSERLGVENLIQEMGELKKGAEDELRSAQKIREEAEGLRDNYQDRMDQLSAHHTEAGAIKREAYEESKRILEASRAKIEQTIESIRSQTASRESIKEAHRTIASEVAEIDDRLVQLSEIDELPAAELSLGGRVRIVSMDKIGYLLEEADDRDTVTVQVGTFKVQAAVKDLQGLEDAPEEIRTTFISKTTGGGRDHEGGLSAGGLGHSLDIRGLRVEEALPLADKYLDDAVLMGMESVDIIHGQGGGVLRSAIAEMLERHTHVASFRSGSPGESGIGVTIAHLK